MSDPKTPDATEPEKPRESKPKGFTVAPPLEDFFTLDVDTFKDETQGTTAPEKKGDRA